MRPIQIIRSRLGVTQVELADGIGRSQSNISAYERGQTIPPEVAKDLIEFARTKGLKLTLDQVYGCAEMPHPNASATPARPEPQRRQRRAWPLRGGTRRGVMA